MTVFEILEKLENTPGSLAKREILNNEVDNSLLLAVFKAAFDPYTVYYVNKFKMPAGVEDSDSEDVTVSVFLDILNEKLSTREVTGTAAKDLVTHMFSKMTPREQKWCQRIILKNLRCGVQESTINKVWPGTIKSFAVALADTLKSEFVKGEGITIKDKVNYPVRVEPKLDGLRCIAVKLNGTVTFYTRNGSVLETLPKIKAALENGNYDNIVLDGEAAGEDWNESASVLMSKKEKKDDSNITYNVFDAVDVADWVRQKCDVAYSDRLEQLHNVIKSLPAGAPVRVVPHIMAKNETELKTYFAKCMDEEYEGVMLKTLDTPYKFKRSDNILKLKPCVTYEGVIVSSYEGRRGTKREGLFGGFEVVLPNGVITRLGGGFSDALKAEIQLSGPESYVGRIVELEAQPDPMTTDGLSYDGKARFPVFCRFRDPSDVDPKVMKAFIRFHAV
jgi:DNA ligase-1